MAVEQFAMNAYATIVSWTYILLAVLFFVKIIQFFSGGSFLGGGGGGTGGEGGPGGGGGGDGNKEPKEPKPEHPEGFTGRVIVRVQNVDRKGIPEVRVSIYAQGKRKWGWFVRRYKLATISTPHVARTDDNGVAEFHSVPAGNVIIELNKEGYHIMKPWIKKYFSIFRRGRNFFYTATFFKPDDNVDLPPFTLLQRGDDAKSFEPTLDGMEFTPDGNANLTVRVT